MFNIKKIIGYIAAGLVGLVVISGSIFGIIKLIQKNNTPEKPPVDPNATEVEPGTARGEQINLQLPLNQWLDTQPVASNSGVIIYDIDHNAVVARHNEDATFDMAQLYQLFIAYEGYYRVARGNWKGDDIYEGLDLDKNTCLDYTLRWSYVECSDRMWDDIGRDNLQSIFSAKNYTATRLNEFLSTPAEISSLMRLYNNHPNFSDDIWTKIKNSLLDQSGNTNFDGMNFRQGLPSGFATAKVYNKAGWYKTDPEPIDLVCAEGDTKCLETLQAASEPFWHTFDDAAIVEFPATKNKDGESIPARHYVIVVMTRETSPRQIVTLGRNIEQFIKTADGY